MNYIPLSLYARVLASITSSKRRGQDSVRAHAQLSRVYLASTFDVTHVIKCTTVDFNCVRTPAALRAIVA